MIKQTRNFRIIASVNNLPYEFVVTYKGKTKHFRVLNETIAAGLQDTAAYHKWLKNIIKFKMQ